MPRGGFRPGAGKPKGTKHQSTITKEQAREALRQIVLREMDGMVAAQIAASRGIGHVYTRRKNGKFDRIVNSEHAEQLLTEGVEGKDYWIFMKDPSTAAFTDLMNRALDKPIEQMRVTGADDGPLVVKWEAS